MRHFGLTVFSIIHTEMNFRRNFVRYFDPKLILQIQYVYLKSLNLDEIWSTCKKAMKGEKSKKVNENLEMNAF